MAYHMTLTCYEGCHLHAAGNKRLSVLRHAKTKATMTLVSLLNMHICMSDVMLSMPCNRKCFRVVTIMLEIL